MDCTFGITGKDFVLVAADCSQTRSVITYKRDEDKVRRLGRRARTFACVLAAARVAGPRSARRPFVVRCIPPCMLGSLSKATAIFTANYTGSPL